MKLSTHTDRILKALCLATATVALLMACTTATTTATANAAWSVSNEQSNISFVTTKAGQPGVAGISETQTFKRFAGGLDKQGQIKLAIDLASVDTGIEIRDERLRTMLWNVKATPQAVFTAKLPVDLLAQVNGNNAANIEVEGQLEMAAQSKPVKAKLRITHMGADSLQVVTLAPIVINASDFGIKAGVEAMREVMGLNFLSSSAPVSFALQLVKQKI
jgi:polyisoprenoid-binding protein YceI